MMQAVEIKYSGFVPTSCLPCSPPTTISSTPESEIDHKQLQERYREFPPAGR